MSVHSGEHEAINGKFKAESNTKYNSLGNQPSSEGQ